jgi:maleylacetate reductase
MLEVEAPRALKDIGMPEAGIAVAAELAVVNPYWNPAPLERKEIEHLIERAWSGLPPG